MWHSPYVEARPGPWAPGPPSPTLSHPLPPTACLLVWFSSLEPGRSEQGRQLPGPAAEQTAQHGCREGLRESFAGRAVFIQSGQRQHSHLGDLAEVHREHSMSQWFHPGHFPGVSVARLLSPSAVVAGGPAGSAGRLSDAPQPGRPRPGPGQAQAAPDLYHPAPISSGIALRPCMAQPSRGQISALPLTCLWASGSITLNLPMPRRWESCLVLGSCGRQILGVGQRLDTATGQVQEWLGHDPA